MSISGWLVRIRMKLDGRARFFVSRQTKLYWWLGSSILVSYAWFFASIIVDRACDAGRGGAIGVVLAFMGFFVSRPHAAARLEKIGDQCFEQANPTEQIESIRSAVAIHLDSLSSETRFVFWASAISTLAWGFGDILARWFGAASC